MASLELRKRRWYCKHPTSYISPKGFIHCNYCGKRLKDDVKPTVFGDTYKNRTKDVVIEPIETPEVEQ